MASVKLENRISELESRFTQQIAELEVKVSELSEAVNTTRPAKETAWWQKIVGVYRDDPEFEEAMRLGREYRESLRPSDEESS